MKSQETETDDGTISEDDVISSLNAAKSQTSITKGNRVLLVDDEIDIADVFKNALSTDGFRVKSYSDPQAALLDYRPDTYDLVISDVRMPKMNGFELCREIRKRDSKVKICFMTAFEIHKEEFEKVLPSIRVDGFITKPVRVAMLRATVQGLLKGTGSELTGK